jgi:putative alpha-1,2-mannosidase
MKKIYPSFANPDTWRDNIKEEISKEEWRKLRLKILERDNFTCQYCGFKAEKWQIVHHIDGNPNNNEKNNLETICPMCNLIHHAGQGCVVQGIVDLYKKSDYSQNEIMQITRKLRIEGKNDNEIIAHLNLKDKTQFKMKREYLKKLFGFVSSRKTEGWTQKSLEYGYRKRFLKDDKNQSLQSFR